MTAPPNRTNHRRIAVGRNPLAPHEYLAKIRLVATSLLVTLLFSNTAHAALSLGAGRDIHFAPGTQGLFLNYRQHKSHFDFFVDAWRGEFYGRAYGIDYRCEYGRSLFAFGGAYLSTVTHLNGTKGNFAIRLGYRLTSHWSLNLRHFSNGKQIFLWTSKPNDGWNFVTLDYTFGRNPSLSTHNCHL